MSHVTHMTICLCDMGVTCDISEQDINGHFWHGTTWTWICSYIWQYACVRVKLQDSVVWQWRLGRTAGFCSSDTWDHQVWETSRAKWRWWCIYTSMMYMHALYRDIWNATEGSLLTLYNSLVWCLTWCCTTWLSVYLLSVLAPDSKLLSWCVSMHTFWSICPASKCCMSCCMYTHERSGTTCNWLGKTVSFGNGGWVGQQGYCSLDIWSVRCGGTYQWTKLTGALALLWGMMHMHNCT